MAFLSSMLFTYTGEAYFHDPVMTDYGIVVTDEYCSTLYLINDASIEKLMSSPGCGRYYSVSSDTRYIGFKRIDSNGMQTPSLYDLATRQIIELSNSGEHIGKVSFCADGRCAFTRERYLSVQKDNNIDTYDLGYYANCAPISPDGRSVVYNDVYDQLWLYTLRTRQQVQITDGKYGYCCPLWSSDSRYIAFMRLDGYTYTYDRAEHKLHHIGKGQGFCWSPDSRYLVYYVTENDGMELTGSDLYMCRYDGAESTQLTQTPDVMEMDPSFIDGTHILFHTWHERELCIGALTGNGWETEIIHRAQDPLTIQYYTIDLPSGTRDSIDVPYLHQVYDSPDWFNGHWACAPTTALMAIAYYRKLPKWECWCSSPYGHTSSYGRYLCERYHYREVDYNWQAQDPSGNWAQGGYGYMWYNGYSPHSRMAQYITYHNMTSWIDDSPTWTETINEVSAEYPYCMCVALTTSGHLVLCVGQVLNWHTLIFNDPYGNKNTAGYPSYDGKYARYDWPGYNNGYQNLTTLYWFAGARGDWVLSPDSIVDDLHFEDGFVLNTDPPSSMAYWWDALTGYNGHSWWTYTTAASSLDTCSAQWEFPLSQPGIYEVYAYIPSVHATATGARYQIEHDAGQDLVIMNQANYADEWVSLGSYQFSSNSQYVYLGDATGIQGQYIAFDAVKWSFQGSGIEEAGCEELIPELVTFRNPVRRVLQFIVHVEKGEVLRYALYDVSGRRVVEEQTVHLHNNTGMYNIDVAHLSAGTYFLELSYGSTTICRKCIILK
jgi:hypothetical protein